jgi:hypothetical protein
MDAFMAAQASAGIVLGAVVWARRPRPWPAMALLLAAIVLAVIAPVDGEFLHGLGMTIEPTHIKTVLKIAAGLATIAAVITRQWRIVVVAALGQAALWPITGYIMDSDSELAATYLAFFGLLAGLYRPTPLVAQASAPAAEEVSEPVSESASSGASDWIDRDYRIDDVVIFAATTLAACLTCWLVLHGRTDSGDEWGNTFQAAVFAKLHASGGLPHCSEAFRSFYVFQYLGRSFAQYTPGWPYFMTPFVALHVPWLAGPASLGLLAVGVAQLGRRAAAGVAVGAAPASIAHVRAGGILAAASLGLGAMTLINGASRYPHVFEAAVFAWSLEALCRVSERGLSRQDQQRWGGVLGAGTALMLATRPGDGATLGLGLFAYFVYALVRRRIGLRAVAMTAAVAGLLGGLTLVILRLQLGRWFQTGYALTEVFYPWDKVAWSLPKPEEYKWGFPLAAGAYCWWPCSPAVGLAGIASLKGRARRLGFVFFLSAAALVLLCTLNEFGRGYAFGYGPRYELPLLVPMAVGTGAVLADLWTRSRARVGGVAGPSALTLGGPVAVAFAAILLGVVRIAPYLYPFTYSEVHSHNRLREAIDTAPDLHNAIVVGGIGLNTTDPLDLTENLPLDLYPDQDVLIAIDRGPDETKCLREKYRGRGLYKAIPTEPVHIVRE